MILEYQRPIVDAIVCHPIHALWVGAGLGKTFCSIMAASELIALGEIRAVLVVAPPQVARDVWPAEIRKFAPDLRVVSLATPEKWRINEHGEPPGWDAMRRGEGDIYLMGYTMLPNLQEFIEANVLAKLRPCHPNMLILDEAQALKDPSSVRRKALVKIRSAFRRRIAMTATPYISSLTDYWSLYELLDNGERLGKGVTKFREDNLVRHPVRKFAWMDPTGDELKAKVAAIRAKTQDITVSMRSSDFLQMEEMEITVENIQLPDAVVDSYEKFREDLYLQWEQEHGSPVDIYAPNADVLVGKLQQFTAGFLYGANHEVARVHREKIDAVRRITADGEPTIVFTGFIEEANALRDELGAVHYHPGILDAWNRGEVKIMTLHRLSCMGLNLQVGGARVVWSTSPWVWSDFEQGNARVHRTGQTRKTSCHLLCCTGTIDESAIGAMARRRKTAAQLLA
jgi:SNF2 family DNA or RNA helicase